MPSPSGIKSITGVKMTDGAYIRDDMGLIALSSDSVIYHYTSAEGLKGLLDGEAWLTERHFLNDPSEFGVANDVILEVLRNHISDKEKCECFCAAFMDEVNRCEKFGEIGDEIAFAGDYVMSFCDECDNALLWSEYSGFQGYCIGFELGTLLDSFEPDRVHWHGRVVYNHEMQVDLVEQMFRNEYFESDCFSSINCWNDLCEPGLDDKDFLIPSLVLLCSIYNMFFKKQHFQGEHEYRIIFSHIHDGGRVKPEEYVPLSFRIRDGVLMPFVKMPFDAKSSIKTIMIGPKNTSDIAAVGLKYFLRSKNMNVDIRKSEIPLRY